MDLHTWLSWSGGGVCPVGVSPYMRAPPLECCHAHEAQPQITWSGTGWALEAKLATKPLLPGAQDGHKRVSANMTEWVLAADYHFKQASAQFSQRMRWFQSGFKRVKNWVRGSCAEAVCCLCSTDWKPPFKYETQLNRACSTASEQVDLLVQILVTEKNHWITHALLKGGFISDIHLKPNRSCSQHPITTEKASLNWRRNREN